jgi:hypothetical protein
MTGRGVDQKAFAVEGEKAEMKLNGVLSLVQEPHLPITVTTLTFSWSIRMYSILEPRGLL